MSGHDTKGNSKGQSRKMRTETMDEVEEDADDAFLQCPNCGITLANEELMTTHLLIHEEEDYPFECGQCDKLFTDFAVLKQHFYSRHTVSGTQGGLEMERQMPEIQSEFLTTDIGVNSTTTTTSNSNTSSSQIKQNSSSQILKTDAATTDGGEDSVALNCPECQKTFSSRKNLKEHLKRHDPEMKVICQIAGCEKVFKTVKDRNRHEIRGHVPLDQRTNDVVFCEICGKRLAHKGLMKEHMMKHNNERPYVCNLCGKSFPRERTLRDHMESKLHGGKGLSWRNKKKVKKIGPSKKPGRKRKAENNVVVEDDNSTTNSEERSAEERQEESHFPTANDHLEQKVHQNQTQSSYPNLQHQPVVHPQNHQWNLSHQNQNNSSGVPSSAFVQQYRGPSFSQQQYVPQSQVIENGVALHMPTLVFQGTFNSSGR